MQFAVNFELTYISAALVEQPLDGYLPLVPSEVDHPEITLPAIREDNLLNKVGFLALGKNADIQKLEKSLVDYRNERGDNLVSRQAISGWAQGAIPRRKNALRFLLDYITYTSERTQLNRSQKKVRRQLIAFLNRKVEPRVVDRGFEPVSKSPGYQFRSDGFMIRSTIGHADVQETINAWEGWYYAYRFRLLATQQTKKKIACEVVRLVSLRHSLHYSHWHRKDAGNRITKFDGCALINLESVWLLGFEDNVNRMRVCHFKNTPTTNLRSTALRWGLMHSDMPASSSREPASTRILFVKKFGQVARLEDLVKRNVRYCSLEDLPQRIRPYVARMIPNELSASSTPGSIEPTPINDIILRVDQGTLQSAISQYTDDGDTLTDDCEELSEWDT